MCTRCRCVYKSDICIRHIVYQFRTRFKCSSLLEIHIYLTHEYRKFVLVADVRILVYDENF